MGQKISTPSHGNGGIYLILVTGALGRIITTFLQDSTGSHSSYYSIDGLLRFCKVGCVPSCTI